MIEVLTSTKDEKKKKELSKIIESELSLHKKYNMTTQQMEIYEDLLKKEMDLQWFNDYLGSETESDEYGEEVYNRIFHYDKNTLAKDYKTSTSIKVMVDAG
jgi:hypothetical protein